MPEQHTRTIELTSYFPDDFNESTEGAQQQVQQAIGYLATWAIHSERKCNAKIHLCRDGCIAASYHDKDGAQTYYIQGQFDHAGKSYSFHS